MRAISFFGVLFLFLINAGCGDDKDQPPKEVPKAAIVENEEKDTDGRLPFIGEMFVENGDTIYHQIRPFGLTNQNGDTITHKDVTGHIYIADFFFTSCGGQCPIMTAALKRVQQNCSDLDFLIISHTIDPDRDTAETFQAYIDKFGIDDSNWHFLTGDRDYIKSIGEESYLAVSGINPEADSVGDLHSSNLYLIDKERHIRGYYNALETSEVDQLIKDLRKLSNEYSSQ